MKLENTIKFPDKSKPNMVVHLFQKLGRMVAGLFQPEEVMVTFKEVGDKTSYTYIKVEQKQVA